MPEVSRTRATFRRAEFGFLGFVVSTRVQAPRRCEEPFSAGLFVRFLGLERPFRPRCWIVGMAFPSALFPFHTPRCRGPRVISPEPLGRSSKAAIPQRSGSDRSRDARTRRRVWARPAKLLVASTRCQPSRAARRAARLVRTVNLLLVGAGHAAEHALGLLAREPDQGGLPFLGRQLRELPLA